MYPGQYAQQHPDRPAFVMASTGLAVTYREYEERCNRLAHLLRRHGLQREDHISIFMENHERYLEACGAGERAGLYYTCINSYLTAEEVAYIVDNSDSQVLIASRAKREIALEAAADCPKVTLLLIVDEPGDSGDDRVRDYVTATAEMPSGPIDDERLGTPMLYSSGTTGRPKGIVRPLPDQPASEVLPLFTFLIGLWQYRDDMVYLSPAPLYHSAPQAAVGLTIRMGGTAVIMERFDPVDYLRLIEEHQVTHTQLVPTMFSPHAEAAGGRARPATTGQLARDRGARCGAVPGAGEGADDRVVGPDHPRVLRRDRGARLHGLQLRGVAGASRGRSAR